MSCLDTEVARFSSREDNSVVLHRKYDLHDSCEMVKGFLRLSLEKFIPYPPLTYGIPNAEFISVQTRLSFFAQIC